MTLLLVPADLPPPDLAFVEAAIGQALHFYRHPPKTQEEAHLYDLAWRDLDRAWWHTHAALTGQKAA